MRINNQRALDVISKQRAVAADRIAELNRREALIRSFERGASIQLRQKGTTRWIDADSLSWLWDQYEYRVKPKSMEFFITVYGDDARAAMSYGSAPGFEERGVGGVYVTAAEARRNGVGGHRIFKVIEVIE